MSLGGRLTIDGLLSGSPGKGTLRGHIEGENYTIVGAPVMARMLAFAVPDRLCQHAVGLRPAVQHLAGRFPIQAAAA